VSTATVSRVLAGQGRARPETRDRVVAAARDLGYRPSGVARSLRQRATRTIGLIVTDIENPFFPQLVRAVEDAARELGYAILLCNADDDPERESGYLELLVDRWVDGVVIAASSLGGRHREWLADAPAADRPRQLRRARPGPLDGRLRQPGRRRPRGVAPARAGPPPVRGPARRHATSTGRPGSRGTGGDGGRRRGERRVRVAVGDAGVGGWRAGGGRGARGAIPADRDRRLQRPDGDRGDAGVRAAGRRVPGDVSVVGFDDVDLAAYVDPPLTTVAQATSEMGRWAVTRLADELAARSAARAGAEVGAVAAAATEADGGNGHLGSDALAPANLVLPVSLRVRSRRVRPLAEGAGRGLGSGSDDRRHPARRPVRWLARRPARAASVIRARTAARFRHAEHPRPSRTSDAAAAAISRS
jgi:LacI family transcriptional regulator